VRQVWLTYGWRPEETRDDRIARHPRNDFEETAMLGELYRRSGAAQFAITERADSSRLPSYDTTTVRWRDRPFPEPRIAVFEATGWQLLELARPANGSPWSVLPLPDSTVIDPTGTYRVAGPFGLVVWSLASRRESPAAVHLVADQSIVEAVRREVWGVRER